MRMILLCFLAFLGYASSTNVLDPRYATSCRLAATEVEPTYSSDCFVALFSYATFAYTGRFITLNHDLCSIPNISDIDRTVAAVVKRGNCSFIEKAKNAQSAGFGLLIIANNEPDAFPMGPPLADFEIKIPVLMSGQDLWVWAVSMSTDQLQAHVQSDGRPTTSIPLLPMLSVTFEAAITPPIATGQQSTGSNSHSDPPPHAHTSSALKPPPPLINKNAIFATRALFATAAAVSVCIVATAVYRTVQSELTAGRSATMRDLRKHTPSSFNKDTAVKQEGCYLYLYWTVNLLLYSLIVAVFVALRLGTLRVYSMGGGNGGGDSSSIDNTALLYNHRETDERVFETLVYNVLRDPTDYKLHPHTIRELRLAEENYSDELFIHPPLFVYLSAFLHGFLHIPLHIIPILFQVLTICLLPVLARKMIFSSPSVKHGGGAKEAFSDDVGLHAMILFGCCPIIAFCSQKFWIDNALMMAVTVCATAHVCLINSENYALSDGKSGGNRVYSLMRHLLSGLLFGTVGLNCKITALALLPFSIGWILLQQYPAYIVHNVEDVTDNRTLWKALLWTAVCCGVYLTGAAVAYAPWAYLYWFYTGRYSPNAWPSASMLQRSPFVQAAVNKPWYTYLLTLLQISPVHVIGIVGALVLAAVMLPRLLCGMLNGVADGAQSPPPGVSDTPSSPSPEVSSEDHPLMQSMSRVHSSAGSASGMPSSAAALQPGAGSRTGSASTIAAGPSLQSTEPPSAVRPVVSMCMLQVLVLSLWPLSFLVGLTLLGSLGSGFQSRFLLPMLPVTCLLSVYFVQWAQQQATADKGDLIMRCLSNALAVVMQLYVVHSVLNVLYYGIMFAPLYADLDVSVVDIVCGILSSAYHAPVSRESFQEMMMFVKHFGLMK